METEDNIKFLECLPRWVHWFGNDPNSTVPEGFDDETSEEMANWIRVHCGYEACDGQHRNLVHFGHLPLSPHESKVHTTNMMLGCKPSTS